MSAPGSISTDPKTVFAARLVQAMGAKKMSQAELARHLGVTRQNLTHLTKGNTDPTLTTVVKIAHLLEVPIGWLAGED